MVDIKKIFVGVFGFTIILIGLALLILPGPGILTIVIGLVLLAGEFVWARKMLKQIKRGTKRIVNR